MNTTPTEKFIQLLKARARSWSEVSAEIGAQIGMRIVKVNGDLVRHALVSNDVEYWLDELFKQLPSDACLLDLDGQVIRLIIPNEAGAYCDRYCLIVASREWEAIKEGGQIPEFEPKIYKPQSVPFYRLEETDLPIGEGETLRLLVPAYEPTEGMLASHLFIASEDQSYCLRCGEPEYHAAHYGKRKIDRESERDSTHPKDRLSTAWQEFIANVGIDHPETHCTVCGLVTWNAWRTGFCLPHFETTNELTKAGQDWLPDETELLHQESGIPLCPECGTNHDMTPELIDNLHNPRHCEMCGSVHRRVDPCPPSATIPNASYGMATTAQQKEAIINKAASMLGVKESEQLRAAINEADKRIVDAIQNTPGRASSDIDGGDPARPHILAENEHLTIYSSSEHLSPAMGAALAGILDAMTVEPWVCIHHNEPVTYTMGQTACELCGRGKDEQWANNQ